MTKNEKEKARKQRQRTVTFTREDGKKTVAPIFDRKKEEEKWEADHGHQLVLFVRYTLATLFIQSKDYRLVTDVLSAMRKGVPPNGHPLCVNMDCALRRVRNDLENALFGDRIEDM